MRISDQEFEKILAAMEARGGIEISSKSKGSEEPLSAGKVFDLSLKRASLKLEQNLGCELPVCVASRRETKRDFIEVVTDEGVLWQLARTTVSLLPAPEHYPYWLWFLDRCHGACEAGWIEPPAILLNPPEIFDLFGAPKRGAGPRGVIFYC